MPVELSTKDTPLVATEKQNPSKGIPIPLTDEQKSTVVMSKFISNNSKKADWEPADVWIEEVVSDVLKGRNARIMVDGHAVTPDDGLIIRLEGRFAGLVGILPGQPPMDEAAVETYQETTGGEPVPMYQRWDFRIVSVLRTDGPQAREALTRTEDQKRLNAQTEMYQAFIKLFQQGAGVLAAQGRTAPNAEEVLKAGALKSAKATGGK